MPFNQYISEHDQELSKPHTADLPRGTARKRISEYDQNIQRAYSRENSKVIVTNKCNIHLAYPCADPENSVSGWGSQSISMRAVWTPREAIGPEGSNCFSRRAVPVLLRKPRATCNFPEGWGSGHPVPSGSAHATYGYTSGQAEGEM